MIYRREHAIRALRPNAHYSINHFNNDAIEAYKDDDGLPVPTHHEIEAKLKELTEAEAMRLLRELRNKLLAESDWVIIKYMTRNIAKDSFGNKSFVPPPWKDYMQALRDLPATQTPHLNQDGELDMDSVKLPEKPKNSGQLKLMHVGMNSQAWMQASVEQSGGCCPFDSRLIENLIGYHPHHSSNAHYYISSD
jgi:hypothetical protein